MGRGRPPLGARLVDRLDGSDAAKRRVRLVLQTLAGERAVGDACAELGVSEAAFHALREKLLQQMVELAEPRRRGRPKKESLPAAEDGERLRKELQRAEFELYLSQIREELLREGIPLPPEVQRSKKNESRAERRRREKWARRYAAWLEREG